MYTLDLLRLLKRCRTAYLLIFTLFALPLASTPSAQAQQQRLTAETGTSIIGSGDFYIPSLRLGYAHQIIPHVNATADLRFSREHLGTPI